MRREPFKLNSDFRDLSYFAQLVKVLQFMKRERYPVHRTPHTLSLGGKIDWICCARCIGGKISACIMGGSIYTDCFFLYPVQCQNGDLRGVLAVLVSRLFLFMMVRRNLMNHADIWTGHKVTVGLTKIT